jgi:hypothetical protein
MAYRQGHGKGKGTPRIEVLPPDELPSVTPSDTDRSDRGSNGQFTEKNTVSRSRRLKVSHRGSLASMAPAEDFRPFAKWGRRYAAHRRGELALAHGGTLSAGAGALIESASLALASSRYLHARAAQAGDAAMLKTAAGLANDARQNELAAWELASREARARPKALVDPLAAYRLPAAPEPDEEDTEDDDG